MSIKQVILCGGVGKRLWPLSRTSYPKPFLPFPSPITPAETITLFSETISRSRGLVDRFITVTHNDYLSLVQGSFLSGDHNHTLCEPCRRNTAPSIALAALFSDPEDILIVTPSDHWISNVDHYQSEVSAAIEAAKQNNLVTFGITPRSPETGYGYIKKGPAYITENNHAIFDVDEFKEKPDLDTAKSYLESGDYFWNSGMFCFKASTYLNELRTLEPELFEGLTELHKKGDHNNTASTYDLPIMERLKNISVDYAIMEKSKHVVLLESHLDWYDLGSFEQLQTLFPIDSNNNTQGDNISTLDAHNNIIISDKRHITTIGVDDLVVVDTADALLISKKGASNNIQSVVDNLKKKKPNLVDAPLNETRPWGDFRVINEGQGFKVKEISVLPGKRLSLQKHQHRSEHWVVASGTATVTIDDDIKTVKLGASVTIPKGAVHRMENQEKDTLKIIEVQYGNYLGEDDIIRIEDDFQRQ